MRASSFLHNFEIRSIRHLYVCALISSTLFSFNGPSRADYVQSTASQMREGVARSAAKIPGFGQPDVFYPTDWLGDWKTTVSITDVTVRNGAEGNDLPLCIGTLKSGTEHSYVRKFIKYDGHVVRDRSSGDDFKSLCDADQVLSFWEPSNPNIRNLRFGNGKVS